jgi:hypothetical protein
MATSANKGFGDLPTTVYQFKEIQNMHTLLNFTCLRIDRNTDADHSYTRCFAARIEFDFKRLQLAVFDQAIHNPNREWQHFMNAGAAPIQ